MYKRAKLEEPIITPLSYNYDEIKSIYYIVKTENDCLLSFPIEGDDDILNDIAGMSEKKKYKINDEFNIDYDPSDDYIRLNYSTNEQITIVINRLEFNRVINEIISSMSEENSLISSMKIMSINSNVPVVSKQLLHFQYQKLDNYNYLITKQNNESAVIFELEGIEDGLVDIISTGTETGKISSLNPLANQDRDENIYLNNR